MKLTLTVIGICVIVFVLQIANVFPDSLAFTPSMFVQEPWTILTSMFMHSSVQHLMLNMIGLFTFGVLLEHEVGPKKWLIIYLTSGFIASLGYALLSASPFIPAVGASGAIFGLIGSMAVLKPKQVIYTGYGPIPMIGAAILWGAAEFISLFSIDNIAHSAHLFGLFGGAILVLMAIKNIDWKIMASLIVIPIVLLFFVTAGMPQEIPGYKPQLSECFSLVDKIETTTEKVYLYSCSNETILSITTPYAGGFNLADLSRALPGTAANVYESKYDRNCTYNETNIDLVNNTAIASGQMCEFNFYSMAKVCDNTEVILIDLYETQPLLKSIDCDKLK